MNSHKKSPNPSVQNQIELILSTVTELTNRIDTLNERISKLEGQIEKNLPFKGKKEEKTAEIVTKTDFDHLDDHLKRTYQTLVDAQKPMTASEVAERMGRSRSTTSYHLNKLFNLDFLEKVPGKSRDNSRNVFFRPKERIFNHIDSKQ
ncbi:MAG: winged helix-turn-helix transcriptional regulator [Candidatus Heimdallarchaeota archaeon]|nr:MAG: winged helix-turn-helix transcriptional regulator [Candidatus Heimdallarchaeota archaeon]